MNGVNRLFVYLGVVLGLSAGTVCAQTADAVAGSIEAVLDGERVVLAPLQSDYQVSISGDLADVELTQRFENPYAKPLNARYLFPLNKRAAVHAMTMRMGDEVITAQIQEIQQAKQTYAKAVAQGKAAALLEQHRPNMFTQKVANLMPGASVEIVINYSQTVPKVDGAYELVVPMVVGPRFQPTGIAGSLEHLPTYPATAGVHVPRDAVAERVALHIDLEAPLPLQAVFSDTHPIAVRDISSTLVEIEFAKGRVLDNKDFVLRYLLGGQTTDAGLLSHWAPGEGGYFSLLIEPPTQVPSTDVLPREMVFLLDCSGSMSGKPMAASKRFMQQALQGLRPLDSFRIIRFSDSATEFSQQPLPATPGNVARGLHYTRSLYGSGGTMMTSGIRQALHGRVPPGRIRNVVFLTDGYIGNEVSVLQLVNDLRGDARLFAFGVGAGVNRYLLDELGRTGHGFTRYFDPTRDDESLHAVAGSLAAKLQTPVLTGLQIDWGGLPVTDVLPAQLPDLYAGNSIRVSGRFLRPGTGRVTVSGSGNTQQAQISAPVTLADVGVRPAVRRVWARTAIAERMHSFITPLALRDDMMSNDQLQAAVTDLGLMYGLATRWTAFVAISRKVYNPDPQVKLQADVALPQVAGVSKLAYSPQAMTGYAAPEPGLMLGLIAAMLTFAGWRRHWRSTPR